MASPRIKETFQRLATNRVTGIIPYITVGFPDVEMTLELAPALAQAGADVIELGVPFSDPLALERVLEGGAGAFGAGGFPGMGSSALGPRSGVTGVPVNPAASSNYFSTTAK